MYRAKKKKKKKRLRALPPLAARTPRTGCAHACHHALPHSAAAHNFTHNTFKRAALRYLQ